MFLAAPSIKFFKITVGLVKVLYAVLLNRFCQGFNIYMPKTLFIGEYAYGSFSLPRNGNYQMLVFMCANHLGISAYACVASCSGTSKEQIYW